MITAAELATRLADYVGTASVTEYETDTAAEALALVTTLMQDAMTQVPDHVANRAALEVAAELWNRRGAPNGIKHFADVEGAQLIRVARDPLVAARPLLAPYLRLATS